MWITIDLHDACGHWHSTRTDAFSAPRLPTMASPLRNASTSVNISRPWRAATGALTTTVAVAFPVFLVGGLAVQVSDDLRFSPAGLGLAVAAYFGTSALASLPGRKALVRGSCRLLDRDCAQA